MVRNRQSNVTGYAIRQNRAERASAIPPQYYCRARHRHARGTLYQQCHRGQRITGRDQHAAGKYQRQLDANATILAELNQKASLKRINDIATEQLGLEHPRTQPLWFDIPEELRDRAAEVRKEFPE
jgi:hypothetical protein